MAEVFHDPETGQNFIKAPGNRFVPVDAADVDIAQESGVGAIARSAGAGLAALPLGIGSLAGDQGAAAQLAEQQRRQEVRGQVQPGSQAAGAALGYAPDIAIGALTGGTGSAALRIGTTMAVEGALGAVRSPDNPLQGAAIQGGLGAIGPAAGPAAGALARGFSKGSAVADNIIGRAGGSVRGRAGPGSVTGNTTGEMADAASGGMLARIQNQMTRNAPPPEVIDRATELGFKLTPADMTGNRAQKVIESNLASNPSAMAVFDDRIATPNAKNLNNIARRSVGLEDGDTFGPRELGEAFDRNAAGWGELTKDIEPFPLTLQMGNFDDVAADIVLPESKKAFESVLDTLPPTNKLVDGAEWNQLRSKLAKTQAQLERAGDQAAADATQEVLEKVVDAAIGTQPANVTAKLSRLKSEYRNAKLLERGSAVTEEGDVSLMGLRSNFKGSKFTSGIYKRGGQYDDAASNDLLDAVRTMSQFRERIGNSGTASRSMDLLSPKAWLMNPAAKGYLGGGIPGAAAGAAPAAGVGTGAVLYGTGGGG